VASAQAGAEWPPKCRREVQSVLCPLHKAFDHQLALWRNWANKQGRSSRYVCVFTLATMGTSAPRSWWMCLYDQYQLVIKPSMATDQPARQPARGSRKT